MAVDTPARIVVIGAGPIGLEAALYARFLGYEVEIYEQGQVGEHVQRWGHVRMYTPFRSNSSSLGLAAVQAQDQDYRVPEADSFLAGQEWLDRYVLPLAETDLLADSLRPGMRAVAISNRDYRKTEQADQEVRAETPLRVVLVDGRGRESDTTADIVIDASGVLGAPNWMGQGGGPSLGELQHRSSILYGIPDLGGSANSLVAGKQVLLVGADFGAAVSLSALCEIAARHPETRVTWVPGIMPGASSRLDRRLAHRAERMAAAWEQAARLQGVVTRRENATIAAVALDAETPRWHVRFGGQSSELADFDQIIASVGHRPDHELYRELQVEMDGVFDRPLAPGTGSDFDEESGTVWIRPETMLLREPNFYVLGTKSYGRRDNFLFADGLQQIRALFAVIGDRAELDLYANLRRTLE